MPFFLMLFLWVAFTVVGELLRPKPKFAQPEPSALGDFQVPTAEEGRCIPIVWGKCLIKGVNATWYGDLSADAVTKKVKTGLFSSTRVTLGYKYSLGMQLVLCHGQIDELSEVRFGDKVPSYTTSTIGDKLRIVVNDENLFGGITKDGVQGGGVKGDIDFYFGTTTQNANDYLVAQVGKNLPGYRGVSYAVFRHLYQGTSSYLKHPAFVVRRCPNQLGLTGGKENIGGDANPACMIYELLTDTRWGLGLNPVMIDRASLIAIGNTLASESFGLSMLVDTPTSANDLMNDILRHIDGVVFTDPQTGLITGKLARADYDIATIPVLDKSNVLSHDFSRGSWSETKNTFKINYTDRAANYEKRVAQDQDLANVQARSGEIAVEQINFLGVSNATAAAAIAARVRRTMSYPIARIHLKTNRQNWTLRLGSVFKLNWEPLGISNLVFRVTRIRYGSLTDGAVEVDAVEDIFSITSALYTPPPNTEWSNPYGAPQVLAFSRLVEAPYQMAGSQMRGVMTYAVRANGLDQGYDVWSDIAGGITYSLTNTTNVFCPAGTLNAAMLKNTAAQIPSVIVTSGRDMGLLASASTAEFQSGVNLLQIGNEILAYQNITDNGNGTYTLAPCWRGIFDTVPEDHASGDRCWFFSDGVGLTEDDPYPADLALTAKLLPFNLIGKLPIASAPQLTITTTSRAWKPLPAGNVKVNALAWPSTTIGDAVATWAKRHRIEQASAQKIVAQDAGDYSASLEGTYTVRVFIGGVLKQTYAGLTATTQTYTAAQRIADDADGTKVTRIRIEPVNGIYTGTAQDRDFIMTGLGMTLGQYLGGIQA